MIHIMGDLRETTQEIEQREQERGTRGALVRRQAGDAGELTTGGRTSSTTVEQHRLFVGRHRPHAGRRGRRDVLVADLEKAMAQVRKATEIISHLRTFGRSAPMTFEPADVHEIIERALSLVQEQLKQRGIDVVFDLCDEDVSVLSNPIQLEQVFINLLTNARDALEVSDVRKIRIASRLRGDSVFITFSDTGPGIPPELEPRVFDPFFTTKEVGSGTGLGLSITYSIVKEHGGEISVVSLAGGGATFTIELPRGGERPPVEPLL